MKEHMVRMGEWLVSAEPETVLASIGLGSCVGVAILDRSRSLAGRPAGPGLLSRSGRAR